MASVLQINEDNIQKAYLAYFGRPADVAGLQFWLTGTTIPGTTMLTIMEDFSQSAEFRSIYPPPPADPSAKTGFYAQFVNDVYNNLFGRDADAEGANFYVNGLATGQITYGTAVYYIISGAKGADAAVVANKLAYAKEFTDALAADILSNAAYDEDSVQIARDAVAGIDDTAGSLTDAIAALPDTLEAIRNADDIAPEFSQAARSVNVAENQSVVATASATDADGDVVTYSLTGADAGKFNINASTGAITFKTAPNFEAPGSAVGTNSYSFNVVASDGVKSSSQAFTVNVTDANEAPAFSADSVAITVQEDTQITGNVNATDVDGNALTYSLLTQATHGEVTVDANGQYYYTPEAGYKGADSFVVRVTDGALTDTMTVNVTVARADAYELTTRVDDRSGYNVFNSSPEYTPGGNDFVNTLQDEDSLEGTAASNDTLNVTLGSVNDAAESLVSPSLTSIEIVNVEITGGADNVAGIDFEDAAGVRELNVNRITANNNDVVFQTLQDSTNDVSLSNATRNGTVEFNWAEGALAGDDDTLAFELKNVEQDVVAITAGDTFVGGDAPEDEGYSFEEVNVAVTGATNVDALYIEPNVEEDTRNGTDQSLNFTVSANLEVNELIAVGVEHASIATSNGADVVVTLNERPNLDGNNNRGLDLGDAQTEDAKAIQLDELQSLTITGNGDVTLNGLNGDASTGVDVDGHTMTGELRLRLDDVVAGNGGSSVRSGSGDDEIITSTDTDADITTNEGDDHVHVKNESAEIGSADAGNDSDLYGDLNTGAGSDDVEIEGDVYGDIDTGRTGGDSAVVDGANDGDTVSIAGNVDEASVVTGAGDDEVEVAGDMLGANIETDADADHVDIAGDLKVVDEDDVSRSGVTTETKPFQSLNAFGAGKTVDYSNRDVTVASTIDTGAGEDTVHVAGVLESGAQWNDNKIDTPSGGNRNVDDTITIVGSEVHLGADDDAMVLRADHGIATDPSPLMEEQTLIDAGSGDDTVLVNHNGPLVMAADNSTLDNRSSLASSPAAEVEYIEREVDAEGNQDTLGAKIDMGSGDDTVTFDDVGFDSVYGLQAVVEESALIIDRGAVVDGGDGDDLMVVRSVDNTDVVMSRNWHDVDGGDVDSATDAIVVGGLDGNDDADGQGGYVNGVEHIVLIAENALSGGQYMTGADGNDDVGVEAPLPNDNEDDSADIRLDVNRVDSDLQDITLIANEQRLELEHTTQPDTEAQDEVDHPNGFIAGDSTYFEIDNERENVQLTLAAYERSGLTTTHNGDLDADGIADDNGLEWDGEGWDTRDDCVIDVTVAVNMDRFATGNNEGFTLTLVRNADLENQDGEENYDVAIVSVDEYALDGSGTATSDEDDLSTPDNEVTDGLLVSQYAREINIVVDTAASHSIDLNNTFGNGSYLGGNNILLGSTTYLNVSGTSDGEVIELENVRADYTNVTGLADIFVYTAGSNQFWITTDEGDDLIDLTSEADFDWERIDGGEGYDRLVVSGGADITGGEFDSVYGIEDLIVEFQEGEDQSSTFEVDSARLDEITIVNNNIGEDGIADESDPAVGVHEVTVSATHDGPGTEHLVVDADVNNAASLEPEMCQYEEPESNRHSDRLVLNLITTAAVIDYATDLEVYVNTAEGTQINLTNQNAAEDAEINVTVSALEDTVIDGTNGGNAEGELEINADSGSVDTIILHNNEEPGYEAGTEGNNVYVTVADDWADSNAKSGPDILIDASEIEDTDTDGFNEYNQFDGRAEDDSQLHIIGTQDRDEIKGGSLGDSLEGESGDDLIYGRMGSDTINGDAGSDQLAGDEDGSSTSESGTDVIDGGTGADFIYGGLKSDTMTGSAGEDRFVYTRAFDSNGPLTNVDRIVDFDTAKDDASDLEHDVIDVRNLVWDEALGFDGADVTTSSLWGKALVFDYTDTEEHILGGNVPVGDDKEAFAVAGNGLIEVIFDQATGELWFDLDDDGNLGGDDLRIKIQDATAISQGLTAANILGASTGNATPLNTSFFGPVYSSEAGFMPGTVVSDHIVIVDGSDTNTGPDGLETLAGTDGAIDLKGGDDWVMVSPSSATWDLHIDGNDGDDTILSGAGDDTLNGGEGDDLVVGGGGADSIHATPGSDTVYGGSGDDNIVTEEDDDLVYGGDGNDGIDSGDGNDTVHGDGANTPSGNDLLGGDLEERDVATGSGADFDDTIVAGDGDDSVMGGAGVDLIFGGEGNDDAEDGNDTIDAGADSDIVSAGAGDDSILGQGGDDTIDGDAGADTIYGGEGDDNISGDDSIIGEDAADVVYGEAGNDFIEAGYGADSLFGGEGDDDIYGDDDGDLMEGGAGDDWLDGEQGEDTIYGDAGNDEIDLGTENDYAEGGEGNDSIGGNDGDDTIYGDSSEPIVEAGAPVPVVTFDDSIKGGAGDDLAYGGQGDDSVDGDSGDDTLFGEEGDDSVDGDSGDDTLFGGEGDDTLTGDEDSDYVEGGAGNDEIYGDDNAYGGDESANDGDDTLFGGVGDDSIYGQGGDDLIDGGLGEDLINAGSGDDTVTGGEATPDDSDTIFGEDGNDLIDGLDGNDFILAGEDDDTVEGGDGNDWIYGGGGNDDIDGEEDDDFIFGEDGSDTIQGGSGFDIIFGGTGGEDSLDGGDSIDGGLGEDSINGQGGDDTITGGGEDDYISGGEGNDDIDGGDGWDSIFGDEGSDTILGGNGDDTIIGGDGNDSNSVDGDDSIDGGAGNDLIGGAGGDDTLIGGDANDTIYGGYGNDDIDGGSGNDSLSGGNGDDTIDGGLGNDWIIGDAQDDLLDGGDGNDTVYGGSGNDEITGGGANDTIEGDSGDDTIWGGDGEVVGIGAAAADGEDQLSGSEGNDVIYGQGDDDQLRGDDGDDEIEGGDGNDTITGASSFGSSNSTDDGDDTLSGGAGNDVIYDGEDNDVIDGGDGNDSVNLQSNDGDTDTVILDQDNTGYDTVSGFNTGTVSLGGVGGDILELSEDDVVVDGVPGANGGTVVVTDWSNDVYYVTTDDNNDDTTWYFDDQSEDDTVGSPFGSIADARLVIVKTAFGDADDPQGRTVYGDDPGAGSYGDGDFEYNYTTADGVDAFLDNQNGQFDGSVYVLTDSAETGDTVYLWWDADVADGHSGLGVTGTVLVGVFSNIDNAEAFLGNVNLTDPTPAV